MPFLTRQSPRPAERMPAIKRLIWIYLFLFFFEGAIRKWLLPQLSAPLLIVRDPFAILIIWEAYRSHRWPRQWAGTIAILCSVFIPLMLMQMVVAQTPWYVALYGLRSYLLPFPVAFVIGEVFDRNDLHQVGKWALFLLLPTVILEILQYRADPSAWINAGASEGASQIGYVGNHVRASGTFSYVAGPMFYIPLAAAFLFYGLVNEEFSAGREWLFWASAGAVVLAIPVTGSRTMVFLLGLMMLCIAIGAFLGVSQFGKTMKLLIPILCTGFLMSFLPIFSEASGSLNERFAEASASEGGAQVSFVNRTITPFIDNIADSFVRNDWIGMGMGYGSNVAAKLTTGGLVFLAGENEIDRLVNELGPLAGIGFMAFRIFLALIFILKGIRKAADQDPLAWLLVPVTVSCLLVGILEQPTEQGFLVISMGLSLAALKGSKTDSSAIHIQPAA